MHPTIWKASGHVDAFNDPLIDNKDSKKRYRADVLIEDYLAKIDEKIQKEVDKAAKKFGEAFDEAQFRATNGRVLEHQAKRDEIHTRFAKALNDSNFEDLRQIIIDCEIACLLYVQEVHENSLCSFRTQVNLRCAVGCRPHFCREHPG